ncbi:PREDICTED: uncharacterized protein LOC109126354 [Camelina sativa]|uniref:Uncharacterized protein LOC109126354 n=1 Tax=Camelina sativa TaxID=90675 RepID=A0ABM1QF71_CAMSA|nr:PREDICTED: uncharacterized protein LOC109126354 [Camelina sativa]
MAEYPDSYMFPSNVHVASSVTLKLNDSNYRLWKTQVESLLSSQKLLGFINGRYQAPPKIVDRTVVRSWIYGTLTEEALGGVCNLATSLAVLTSLANTYNRSSISREFELKRKLHAIRKQGKTFSAYVREYTAVCDELNSIGKPVEESIKICGFLLGLGREYDPIAAVIQNSMSRIPTPTFTEVLYEIEGFDTRLQSYADDVVATQMVFHTPTAQTQEVFQASQTNNYRGRGGYNNRSGSNRGRGGYSSLGLGFYQQAVSSGSNQQSGATNTRPTCQICCKVGHTAAKCWNRFDNNYQGENLAQVLAALQVSDSSGRDWIPDSGATSHVTTTEAALQHVTPYQGTDSIMVADGNYLPITHVGSTSLPVSTGSLTLNDVLVCPTVKKSLLSISKLCDDYPCGVFFDSHKVYILDLQTMRVLTKGPRREGLYVLENQDYKIFY